MSSSNFERLTKDVVPLVYHLHIFPNLETFKFTGNLEVELEIKKSTNEIICYAAEIEIESCTVGDQTGNVEMLKEEERVKFTFENEIKVGKCLLKIHYSGIHNDKRMGFYRSKFTKSDGTDEWALASHFEPVQARYALPCWDEPALRSKFNIKMTIPSSKTALSCMDVLGIEQNPEKNESTYTFSETPLMSTYLLAMCVGNYDFLEDNSKTGTKVRIYTNQGDGNKAKFALEVAVKCLNWYQEYFKIDYPLPKCDLIAIDDFTGGAMENWGLITFRSSCLLFDDAKSSTATKQRVAIVVAHELAHMWFGNLVTIEWWTHLWLKEGFATFMEYLSIDSLYPDMKVFEFFLANDYNLALSLDAMDSSHPVEVPVKHPGEVNEIFDTISYKKGCSIIRMLYEWIGDDNFRRGMHTYLKKYSYSAAQTEDLWTELEAASNLPVAKVMSDWTKRMGFPVVFAEIDNLTDSSMTIKLSQWKFSTNSEKDSSSPWNIPVNIKYSNGTKNILMDSVSTTIEIENFKSGDWVLLNSGAGGFYHVQYSPELFQILLKNLSSLNTVDRLKISTDSYSLCRVGLESSENFLTFFKASPNETEYSVISDMLDGISTFKSFAAELGVSDQLNELIIKTITSIAENIGWESKSSDTHITPLLRALVLTHLGLANHEATIKTAKEKFQNYTKDQSSVPADLKTTIMKICAKKADSLDEFISLHSTFQLQEERDRVEVSIGQTNRIKLIEKVIEFAFSGKVRNGDIPHTLASVARGSTAGREAVWKIIQNKIEFLKEELGGQFLLSNLLKSVISGFQTKEKIVEVEEFFEKNPVNNAKMAIKQGIENIRINADWIMRDGEKIKNFLNCDIQT